MGRLLLRNAVLLDPRAFRPEAASLLVEGGRIAGRLAPDASLEDVETVDLAGRELAPGLVDLHFHGHLPFSSPAEQAAALRSDSASLARHGVTAFLATGVAWSREELGPRVTQLARVLDAPRWPGAVPIGIHLEGPWIAPGAAGAQPGAAIRGFRADEGEDVLGRGAGAVRMVTLAPEVEGAGALLSLLARRGVVAALGHSLADAGAAERAVAEGARHVTHLFNAMGPLHHRAPGLAGAALAEDRLSCDLICDGVHVHPRMVALAARAKGPRLALISDRIDPVAAGASFGSGPLRDDGRALYLSDGRLAGSRLTLDVAVRRLADWSGATSLEALAAATLVPARVLGVERERGTLDRGARADFAIFERGGGVAETWVGGEPVGVRDAQGSAR